MDKPKEKYYYIHTKGAINIYIMKSKYISAFIIPLSITLFGCNNKPSETDSLNSSIDASNEQSSSEENNPFNLSSKDAIYLSNVDGKTDDSKTRIIRFKVSQSGAYYLCSYNAANFEIYDNEGKFLTSGIKEAGECLVNLTKGKDIFVKFITNNSNEHFNFEIFMDNDTLITLPYDLNYQDVSTQSDKFSDNPLKPATINYTKRDGGTYIFCNNPEALTDKDIGVALQKNNNLSGEIYFTLEHSNNSSSPFYLGYQVKNETDHDIYVTIKNVGYQNQGGGAWLGQHAWEDFYNVDFTVDEKYLNGTSSNTKAFKEWYNFDDYTPRIYTPTTYILPANQAFYVMGGTSEDSYNNINIDNSADRLITKNQCVNGNVLFDVKGGTVTGTLYCYNKISQVNDSLPYQGYITYRDNNYFGGQYKGIAYHHGVIDNNMSWTFNDNTPGSFLPIYLEHLVDRKASTTVYEAFAAYSSTKEIYKNDLSYTWITNYNPQYLPDRPIVGTDMVAFECNLPNGQSLLLDNEHAGADGKPGNFGNWMIEYQDNYTFINQGNQTRKINIYYQDQGSLAMLVRDNTGKILRSEFTFGRISDYGANKNGKFFYTVEVSPHSTTQITFDYNLLANGNGSIEHQLSLLGI